MEQRACNRINGVGMEIDISDKVGATTGTVKNVSRFGVCVTNMPRKLFIENKNVTAIISVKRKQFSLQLRPQWEKQNGLTLITGATIDNPTSDWIEMVMLLEREDEDLWSLTR